MKSAPTAEFDRLYQSHLKHLTLKGLQPKTIEAYARAMRRAGAYFDQRIDALTEAQPTDYFADLFASHSLSAVKLDRDGLKFFFTHVLRKPWVAPDPVFEKGVSLSKEAMRSVEARLQRNHTLPKWDILITPVSVV